MEIESKFKIGSSVLVLEEIYGVFIVGSGEIVGIEKPRGLAANADDKVLYTINFYERKSFSLKTGTELDIYDAIKNTSLLKFKEESLYTRDQEEDFKKKAMKKYTELQDITIYNVKNFINAL